MGLKKLIQTVVADDTHTIEVDGEELTFRRCRLDAVIAARPVLEAVALAVSSWFDPSHGDYVKRTFVQEGDETTTIVEAISPVSAVKRQEKQDAAITRAADALLRPENIDSVLGLVIDSLREDMSVEELRQQADLGTIATLVRGMMEANARVFGPFVERVEKAMKARLEAAQAATATGPVGVVSDEPESEEASETAG